MLGKKGFSKRALARPTVVAAATYGCENTGYADSPLKQLRTSALQTVATATSGGSLDAEWMARDGQNDTLDPAFAAHSLPICSLAEAWWCRWRQEDKLREAHDMVVRRLARPLKGNASVWARAKGPTAAAILSAGRIGWVFESADRIITDNGRVIELGVDSPADVRGAVEDSVRRWRTANVLNQFTATKNLLKHQQGSVPPGVVPCMKRQWRRAAAAATLHTHEGNFDVLLGRRRGKVPTGWKPKYAAHLLSAVSNKQWPQARVAATRHPEWNTTAACQLCYAEKGTSAHRHACPRVLETIGAEAPSDDVRRAERGMTEERRALWRTRGIGAFRIFPSSQPKGETLSWVRKPGDHICDADLTWFVDASQVDGDDGWIRSFGIGLLATDDQGKMVAAAYGHPPEYVSTISQAEAHAVAAVLEATMGHNEIVTDCQSNVRLLHSGFQTATDPRRRSARTWRRIQKAADGDESAVKLRWVPAHCSWLKVCQQKPGNELGIKPLEWQGNRAVDELAKKAAFARRAPALLRESLDSTRRAAMQYRARLGAVTHASQNYEWQELAFDGKVVTRSKRDSTGKPPGNLPPHIKKAAETNSSSPEQQQVPQQPTANPASAPTASSAPTNSVPKQEQTGSRFQVITAAIDNLFQAVKLRGRARRTAVQVIPSRECPEAKRRRCDEALRLCHTAAQAAMNNVERHARTVNAEEALDVCSNALSSIGVPTGSTGSSVACRQNDQDMTRAQLLQQLRGQSTAARSTYRVGPARPTVYKAQLPRNAAAPPRKTAGFEPTRKLDPLQRLLANARSMQRSASAALPADVRRSVKRPSEVERHENVFSNCKPLCLKSCVPDRCTRVGIFRGVQSPTEARV